MTSTLVRVEGSAGVDDARLAAVVGAEAAHLDDVERAHAGEVAAALATNVCRAGGSGVVLVRPVGDVTGRYVEILAIDRGAPLDEPEAALQPAAALSAEFDAWSAPAEGAVVVSRVGRVAALRCEVGAVSVPFPGETECGDGYFLEVAGARARLAVVDGLGHGHDAAEATRAAIGALSRMGGRPLAAVMEELHEALRRTRGAAVGLGDVDFAAHTLEWIGIGNIAGSVPDRDGTLRGVASYNGIVGHNVRGLQSMPYSWGQRGHAVFHTDGVSSTWVRARYPGVQQHHPAIFAGLIFRDHCRGRDDATVLVVRERRPDLREAVHE
ncbi:MAG: SpoIIE family protein phosphatase [Deltaproteobacteria bacterium]|nr:SpoIIE family protein phosphatase [Deltaproteobacteria bacterium]